MNWCICKHPAFGTTMNHAECSTARCSIGGVARGLPKSFRWNWTCVTIDHRTMNLCFVWFCQAMLLPMRHARMMFIQLRKNGTAQCYMIVYNIHSYTYTVYTPYFISIEYIYTWKTIKTKFSVRTGLDMFFVRYGFFPNTAMSGCKPSTYRSIVFLKSWICRTGSDSMSVSSRDSIWMYLGQYVDICLLFFLNMMLKKI